MAILLVQTLQVDVLHACYSQSLFLRPPEKLKTRGVLLLGFKGSLTRGVALVQG